MDLDVVMRSSDCKYIVKFYGALFTEVITPKNIVLVCFFKPGFYCFWRGRVAAQKLATHWSQGEIDFPSWSCFYTFLQGDAWICMELMDTSLDQCYRHLYGVIQQSIPEDILGMTSLAVSYTSHYCNLAALTGTYYCSCVCEFPHTKILGKDSVLLFRMRDAINYEHFSDSQICYLKWSYCIKEHAWRGERIGEKVVPS